MNALAELLDAVRERSGLPSDMALATKLGIQRQTLHQARKGVAGLSDERIAQLCELGKLDGAVWLAKIHAERATSPVERRVWRSVLDRLSAAAAVLVLAVIAVPGAARAKAIESQGFSGSDQPHSVYYVQNKIAIQAARASQPSDPRPHPGPPCPLNPRSVDSQTESAATSHHLPVQRCSPAMTRHHAGTRCDSGSHAADSRTPPSSRHGQQ